MTVPTDDLAAVRNIYPTLEGLGYDRVFSFESKHDPFIPIAVASQHTDRLQLGTALAIAFARTPMTVANAAWDLQALTGGRFHLGLGSQIKPHIEQRFSMPWSRPADRMREFIQGIHAIWDSWQDGSPLDFEGDFYTHTRMVPAFNPGPIPHRRPPILLGAVGPAMTTVAGEVADGLLVHPVNTRKSLLELTLPKIAEGAATAGREVDDIEVICVTIIVTGSNDEEMHRSREAVRNQLAFYATTPAYRPVFDLHGYDDLHAQAQQLARAGRWDDMGPLVDDELIETVAVVGQPHEIAGLIRSRLDGISDSISLVNNRAPDPSHFAQVVSDLKG
ncbi:MAG TPA: TIGR03617 family F420-dependent LLM class oxidoreductase [Microthrixaceae bacterium]|nr:TIGR03617 family F420-dependent LLM class oxidoreductase [Microthrixaceae bacterium]